MNPIIFVFFISLFMCFEIIYYFNSIFGKETKSYKWILCIVFVAVNIFYLSVNLPPVISSAIALLMIFIVSIPYKAKLINKLVFSFIYVTFLTMLNFIATYLLYLLGMIKSPEMEAYMKQEDYFIYSIVVFTSLLIMFVLIQIIKIFVKKREFLLNWHYYIVLLLIPLFSIFQINILAMRSEQDMLFFITIVSHLLVNILVVYMFDNIIDKFEAVAQNTRLQQQMDYQETNYEKTVHSFQDTKRMIHDINQHYIYVDECIKKGELEAAREHIKTTLNKIEDSYLKINSGNLVIDSLVSNTVLIGKASGIEVESSIKLLDTELPIERYDLCIVLGNMLDNAMEASKKIKMAEDRYISVKIRSSAHHLLIHVMNYTGEKVLDLNTTKDNPEYHGIGLKNIANICEKYGGNMTIDIDSKTFNNMAILPFE